MTADAPPHPPAGCTERRLTFNRVRRIQRRLAKRRREAERRFERYRRLNRLAAPGPAACVPVLHRLRAAHNIGKIFRTADAFGAREVHLVGIDFFDPAPSMGSFKHVPARFHDDFAACHAELTDRGYTVFALTPDAGADLTRLRLPEKSAFVFGSEGQGLGFDPDTVAGLRRLRIPQVGRVESLNVAVAAALVLYEYLRQHGPPS